MNALSLLVTIWPAIFAGGIAFIGIMDPPSADEWLFGFIGLYIVFSIILAAVYGLCGRDRGLTGWSIAAKAVSTAAQLAAATWVITNWIQADIATQSGAMEAFLGPVLLIILLLPWHMADGMLRISLAVRCSRLPRETVSRWHILWHLIPVADLVSAIIVHRQLKSPT